MTDPHPVRRRRRSRRLTRACFAAVIAIVPTVLGVSVLEWYLRANSGHFLGPPAELHGMFAVDDLGRFHTTPYWHGAHTVDGAEYAVRLNALGFRGPELPPRSPGQARVLVLGDSFPWGYGVDDGEPFPAVLERLLARRLGRPVVVANAGAPSFGTRDQVAVLERWLDRVDPDLIVSCTFLGNDFTDNCVLERSVVAGYALEGPLARFANESLRVRLALRFRIAMTVEKLVSRCLPALAIDLSAATLTPEEARARAELPPEAQRGAGLFVDAAPPTPEADAALARLRTSFTRLAELAGPRPLLCVVIPTAAHVLPGEYGATLAACGLDPARYARGEAQRRLLEVAAGCGASAIDLTPLFDAEPDVAALWQPVGRHFSVAGHRRVAEWLLPWLADRLGE